MAKVIANSQGKVVVANNKALLTPPPSIDFPKYTGHVDTAGLTALGWDSYDIQWLQDHVWWDAEDDAYWAVTEANLAFGPNGATPLTWADRASVKENPDVRYFPKFDLAPSSNTGWGSFFADYRFLCAIPTHGWNTTNVTSLASSFAGCRSLRSVGDLSGWNTGKVTTLSFLFNNCANLLDIGDISNWNTSSVTTLNGTFQYCQCLRFIGSLSQWDTSLVESIRGFLYQCRSLQNIDVSSWNVEKVTDAQYFVCGASSLLSVGDLSDWDTESFTAIFNMFNGCSKLVSVGNIGKWDTSNITSFSGIFQNCFNLTYVGDLSNWDVSKSTELKNLFSGCYLLKDIGNIGGWDVSNVTDLTGIFFACISLCKLNLSEWDVEAVTTIQQAFNSCYQLDKLDLSGWSLSACTYVGATISPSAFGGLCSVRTLKLGPHFFDGTATTYHCQQVYCWTRDSVYESLYTNQTLRNSQSTAITVKLYASVYDSLSAQDISDIATKNITLTRG